jgi:D-alanyl-D-alanine carboxypeptidase
MIELMELAFADGAAAEAPTLDGMAVAGQEEPPPHILGAAECSTAPGIAGGGRKIPGWAAIFGFYSDKASAQQAVQQARAQLAGVLKRGQPAVVQRQTEGVLGYAALIVGLKQEEAGAACKAMWGAGGYCLALSPEVLANPNALWR